LFSVHAGGMNRIVFGQVIAESPRQPFHVRRFNTTADRAGIAECIKRQLILPYPVLYERCVPAQGPSAFPHLCVDALVCWCFHALMH